MRQAKHIHDVKFDGITGNCFWLKFPSGRLRRVPCKQVLSRVRHHFEPQSLIVTAELFDELQRSKLIPKDKGPAQ